MSDTENQVGLHGKRISALKQNLKARISRLMFEFFSRPSSAIKFRNDRAKTNFYLERTKSGYSGPIA